MRILHVIDSAGLYGAETVLLNLAAAQMKAGLAPVILSVGNKRAAEKAIEAQARRSNIPCIPLRMRDGLNVAGAWSIVQLARSRGIDIFHSHNYKSNILLGMIPPFARRIPLITTLHGWTSPPDTLQFSRMSLYCYLDSKILRWLDAVVTVSTELYHSAPIERLPAKKTHLIPNGIPLRDEPAAPQDALSDRIRKLRANDCMVLGAIGRLSAEKNFALLVEAFALLAKRQPRLRLLILGDGPQASLLAELIDRLDLSQKILLQGYVADAAKYMPLFDALLISSTTEGLPMVLLEAMAAGTPIISTAVGGIPGALRGQGRLVEAGDVAGFAAAIEELASHPESYAARALHAKKLVETEYSASTMELKYRAVYQSVMQSRHEH